MTTKRKGLNIAGSLDRPHLTTGADGESANLRGNADAILPPDPARPVRIRVTLPEVIPFRKNPRFTRNPKYDEIKESIRNTGLDHPPNVTREFPSDPYMIKDGGNTRLQILNELWEETQDERFYSFECIFHPWPKEGEKALIAAHARENEMRGDTLFIEKARAAIDLGEIYAQELGEELSVRALAKKITSDGWTVHQPTLSQMIYAHNVLYPFIPQTLESGLGRDGVQKIRKLLESCGTVWQSLNDQPAEFEEVWHGVFRDLDSSGFDNEAAEQALCEAMSVRSGIDYSYIAAQVQAVSVGSPNPANTDTATYSGGGPQQTLTDTGSVSGVGPAAKLVESDEQGKKPLTKRTKEQPPVVTDTSDDSFNNSSGSMAAVGDENHQQQPVHFMQPVVVDAPGSPGYYRDWIHYDDLTLIEEAVSAARTYAAIYGIESSLTISNTSPLGYRMRTDVPPTADSSLHWLVLHLFSHLNDPSESANKFLDEYVPTVSTFQDTSGDYNAYMLITVMSLKAHAFGEAIKQSDPSWMQIWESLTTLEVISGILQTRAQFYSPEPELGNIGGV